MMAEENLGQEVIGVFDPTIRNSSLQALGAGSSYLRTAVVPFDCEKRWAIRTAAALRITAPVRIVN